LIWKGDLLSKPLPPKVSNLWTRNRQENRPSSGPIASFASLPFRNLQCWLAWGVDALSFTTPSPQRAALRLPRAPPRSSRSLIFQSTRASNATRLGTSTLRTVPPCWTSRPRRTGGTEASRALRRTRRHVRMIRLHGHIAGCWVRGARGRGSDGTRKEPRCRSAWPQSPARLSTVLNRRRAQVLCSHGEQCGCPGVLNRRTGSHRHAAGGSALRFSPHLSGGYVLSRRTARVPRSQARSVLKRQTASTPQVPLAPRAHSADTCAALAAAFGPRMPATRYAPSCRPCSPRAAR